MGIFRSGCRWFSAALARRKFPIFQESLAAFFDLVFKFHRTTITYFGCDGRKKSGFGGEHTDSNHLLM
jgi:hypothetical protein